MILGDLIAAGILLAYYLVFCFIIPTLLKAWGKFPNELVRKFQHIAFSLSIFLLLDMFSTWYAAILGASLLIVVAYPALMLMERTAFYKRYLVDRTAQGGEMRRQMIYIYLTFALLIFLYWGVLGTRWYYITAVAVMAWGFGDAAAALVGKAFGRRRIVHSLIEKTKTIEGTTAMVSAAAVALFFTMLCYAGKPWYTSLAVSLVASPAVGAVELFSRKGSDTFTVPLTAAAIIMPLVYLISKLGG
ncbi:MAG: diacylglycerol/polyprenol kinase family protein [Anaerolineales bacterium]